MTNNLLILSREAEQYENLLTAAGLPELQVRAASSTAAALPMIGACEIVLGEPQLVSEVLASAKQLTWVQSCWAGVDSLCLPDLRRDYVLTGVTGQFGHLIAEYVTGYLFALERSFFAMRSNQLQRRWQLLPYRRPGDITVGIVGLGSIGQHLAGVLAGFGFRITGMNTNGQPCEAVEQVFSQDRYEEFFAAVDYLVITLPLTPQTRHFINIDSIRKLPPGAVIMNVGRGSVIDESALIQALQAGEIRAAVLDVFETEPLPSESPLWTMPNVYVTPHVSALSFPEDIVAVFKENYLRYLNNDELLHVVNFERGY